VCRLGTCQVRCRARTLNYPRAAASAKMVLKKVFPVLDSPLVQVDVLEPVALLLRRMPRYARSPDRRGSAGRDFDDFAEFQHYRCGERCIRGRFSR